jgi:hypothetical protein
MMLSPLTLRNAMLPPLGLRNSSPADIFLIEQILLLLYGWVDGPSLVDVLDIEMIFQLLFFIRGVCFRSPLQSS